MMPACFSVFLFDCYYSVSAILSLHWFVIYCADISAQFVAASFIVITKCELHSCILLLWLKHDQVLGDLQ